jgi:hypothetical protein
LRRITRITELALWRFPARRRRYVTHVPKRYLVVYLNDHLAGSTLGVELARRTLRENPTGELGDFLRGLEIEIVEDRKTLLSLMQALGVAPSRAKVAAGWAAEKIGRAKLNGQLTGYSPLSRLVELEGLADGIDAKLAMWLALERIQDRDERLRSFDLAGLARRARSQRERLEPCRLEAAAVAFE